MCNWCSLPFKILKKIKHFVRLQIYWFRKYLQMTRKYVRLLTSASLTRFNLQKWLTVVGGANVVCFVISCKIDHYCIFLTRKENYYFKFKAIFVQKNKLVYKTTTTDSTLNLFSIIFLVTNTKFKFFLFTILNRKTYYTLAFQVRLDRPSVY